MAKVNGIGGYFFRAKDPAKLKAWYAEHLGIENQPIWEQDAGPTAFEPFSAESNYFPAEKQAMVNLRTDDLSGLTKQLEAAGIEVITKPEWDMPEVGYFARIHDPEGNPIELWQPVEGPIPG